MITSARNELARVALLVALGVLAGGCSSGQPAPVNPDRAQDALKAVLDGWKEQKSPAEVRAATNITIQDQDWEGGMKLLDYQIKGTGREQDAHLRCPVELVLKDKSGKESRKTVTYIIGTSPQLTVFREVFPQ